MQDDGRENAITNFHQNWLKCWDVSIVHISHIENDVREKSKMVQIIFGLLFRRSIIPWVHYSSCPPIIRQIESGKKWVVPEREREEEWMCVRGKSRRNRIGGGVGFHNSILSTFFTTSSAFLFIMYSRHPPFSLSFQIIFSSATAPLIYNLPSDGILSRKTIIETTTHFWLSIDP